MSTKKKRPSGNPARARTDAQVTTADQWLIEAITVLPDMTGAAMVHQWWDIAADRIFDTENDPVIKTMCINQLMAHPDVPIETLVELHNRFKLLTEPESYEMFWQNLDLLWTTGRPESVVLGGAGWTLPPESAFAMAEAMLSMVQRSENTAMLDELWEMARRYLLFSETTPPNLQTLVDAFETNPSTSDAVTAQAMQRSVDL